MADYKDRTNKYYNLTTGAYTKFFGDHFHLFIWHENQSRDQAKAFLKTLLHSLTKSDTIKTARDIFHGPIYTKLCLDAGVFKLGYFVLLTP